MCCRDGGELPEVRVLVVWLNEIGVLKVMVCAVVMGGGVTWSPCIGSVVKRDWCVKGDGMCCRDGGELPEVRVLVVWLNEIGVLKVMVCAVVMGGSYLKSVYW